MTQRVVKLLAFLFFLLIYSTSGTAQTFDFISYGVEDGLSQSEVQTVFQDSRGYLWVGTTGGGACSFDGVKFHEYGKRDGLSGQVVNCIAEDSTGNIWFGTQRGVCFFNGKKIAGIDSEELQRAKINSIVALPNAVWIGGPGGIYEYTISNQQVHKLSSMQHDLTMCADESGVVWVGSGSTLYRFNAHKKDSVDLHLPAGKNIQIISICSDRHGLLYIGTNDGLIIYRPSTGTSAVNELTAVFAGKTIHDIYTDHDGAIWLATLNNLVVKYKPGSIVRYDRTNGLSAEGILHITEDNTHHMWFATREQSLLKLRSETFTYFGNVAGFGSGTVFRIMEDHEGKIWCGSNQEGLYCYDPRLPDNDPRKSVPVFNAGGRPFVQPVAIIEDNRQQVWVGHYDGLTCLANGHPVKQLLSGIRVRSLLQDRNGNIWAGTWGKGVYLIKGQETILFNSEKNKLPSDFIHALYEARDGTIWMGTGNGLVSYDGETFKVFGIAEGLCNTYIGSLTEDKAGNIWFHTDECVMRYDGKKFIAYSDANGLVSNTFYLLSFDSAGYLWVGTNKGVDRMEVDEAGRVLSVKNFSRNEGFRGIECNSRAVCLSRDGCLWFGTVKGVIRYDPSKELTDNVQPVVHLTGIRLFLEQTDWALTGAGEAGWFHLPVKLELGHEHNHLTFTYEAIHLQSPQATRYKFMLAGFDSVWQPVTAATEITYANLPPGHYVFRVMASNIPGKWDAAPVQSCPITILSPPPPFWQTGWFLGIAVLFISFALYTLVVSRNRRSAQLREKLEEQVRERTLEISRQNEEKTVMLKEIHHRVKNNLQVISSLLNLQAEGITDKRVLALFEDCRHRVNSMALIHEKMYQSKTLVNIDIRNYIDELIRSLIDAYDSNKSIHLDSDIEEHPFRIDTIVPLGLILNEIISNSLKYAFADREEGTLFISLHKTGPNRFLLEVSDNGKGIPPTLNFETAESLGMQLIHMLSGQINGNVEMTTGNKGTVYRISFQEEAKDRF